MTDYTELHQTAPPDDLVCEGRKGMPTWGSA
jgi:hypothetical protein